MVSPLFLAVWPLLLSRAGPPLHMSAVNQGTQPAQRFFWTRLSGQPFSDAVHPAGIFVRFESVDAMVTFSPVT